MHIKYIKVHLANDIRKELNFSKNINWVMDRHIKQENEITMLNEFYILIFCSC